jgi:hypothetical protein
MVESVPAIVNCEHIPMAQWLWMHNEPGEPPEFCYSGLPEAGRVVMAKNMIIVVCHRCSKELNNLQKSASTEYDLH